MKKDYGSSAKQLVQAMGGKDNITRVFHCMTRLRFYVKDRSKIDEAAIKKLSEIYRSIREIYGSLYMEERSYTFTPEKKEELNTLLMEERKVPSLPFPVSRISTTGLWSSNVGGSRWITHSSESVI